MCIGVATYLKVGGHTYEGPERPSLCRVWEGFMNHEKWEGDQIGCWPPFFRVGVCIQSADSETDRLQVEPQEVRTRSYSENPVSRL